MCFKTVRVFGFVCFFLCCKHKPEGTDLQTYAWPDNSLFESVPTNDEQLPLKPESFLPQKDPSNKNLTAQHQQAQNIQ